MWTVCRFRFGSVCAHLATCGTRRCALTTVFSESYQFAITGFTRSLCRIRARDARGPVPIGGTRVAPASFGCSFRAHRCRTGGRGCVKREIRQTFRLQVCSNVGEPHRPHRLRSRAPRLGKIMRILKGYTIHDTRSVSHIEGERPGPLVDKRLDRLILRPTLLHIAILLPRLDSRRGAKGIRTILGNKAKSKRAASGPNMDT